MSDEHLVMALLAEGNPATEVMQDVMTEVPAATYLATLKQRSSEMTKTDQPITTKSPGPRRGLAWALAAVAAILAIGGLSFLIRDDGQVANQTTMTTSTTVAEPTPTTVATDVEMMTDLEVIETGVTALYSGDADRAAELFELTIPQVDAWIRAEAAFQAGIDARITLNCSPGTSPGTFSCHMPYHNAMTDAVKYFDSGDTIHVVIEEGLITEFDPFPVHSEIDISLGEFLLGEGYDDYTGECGIGLFPESSPRKPDCASLIMDNLDEWAAWHEVNRG